jgi:hypothetical protein
MAVGILAGEELKGNQKPSAKASTIRYDTVIQLSPDLIWDCSF